MGVFQSYRDGKFLLVEEFGVSEEPKENHKSAA